MSVGGMSRRSSKSSIDRDRLWLDYHQHLLKSAMVARKWRGIDSDDMWSSERLLKAARIDDERRPRR